MDALTPSTDPQPAPPVPATPATNACTLCGGEGAVNWQRRPTDAEYADVVQAEEDRRDQIRLLADPQLPAPEFGPLPTAEDMTRAVYGCVVHAIGLEAASRIHASRCTAPNEAHLPGCDCTPEPPPLALADEAPVLELPAHWVAGDA